MRGAAWGVLLLTAACSQGASYHGVTEAAPAAAPAPAESPAPIWDVERADPASRRVDITYLAAACSAVRRIDVAESADRVVITLGAGTSAGKECVDPTRRHRSVTLTAPLGGRALYDGGAAPPVLVRGGT